jgi:hypothetical protein
MDLRLSSFLGAIVHATMRSAQELGGRLARFSAICRIDETASALLFIMFPPTELTATTVFQEITQLHCHYLDSAVQHPNVT